MKFVRKFNNFINESFEPNASVVDDIVSTMESFIDDGEKIVFQSSTGDMEYKDFLSKNSKYENFKPVLKAGNRIISKFKILYKPKNNDYDGLVDVMDNMKSCIGRLKEHNWILSDYVVSTPGNIGAREVKINFIQFKFEKPEVELEEEFETPDEDDLREKIEQLGVAVRDIYDDDGMIRVDFASYAYDGELNSESWYDERFDKICDLFGFAGYDLQYQKAMVYFEY